jgi:hypothetical protein
MKPNGAAVSSDYWGRNMAISMEELMRAFGRPMNPNVQQVQDMSIRGIQSQPAQAPAQTPMPAPAPQQQRGLLGGFFGPQGRDARARLAIALEGMTMNPNQALVGELQRGIETRASEAQRNATVEWLKSRGRDDLAAAIAGGLPAADALRIAMEPAPQTEQTRGVVVGGNVVDPITGQIIYQGPGEAPSPQSAIAKLEADRRAGLITDEQYKAGMQALAPQGMTIESDGAGGFRMVQGAGVSGTGAPTVGQVYNPNEIQSVVGMIDQIATDPNLPNVVGQKAVVVGGGNKISDMNITQRLAYGQEGLGLIERIGQLQSNAWLSARQMLKGGGAITDYESQKAEAAVARLERPKSEEEFKQALKDLRDAIVDGEAKLRAQQGGTIVSPQGGPSDDDLLRMYGG